MILFVSMIASAATKHHGLVFFASDHPVLAAVCLYLRTDWLEILLEQEASFGHL